MLRRLVALIAVLGLVVVPPVLLLAWGFTDLGSLSLWGPSDVRVLLAVLTSVGWLAWGVWMVALLLEGVGMLAGRRLVRRLPGLSAPRALAALLLSSIIAAGGASAASAGTPLPVTASAGAAVPGSPSVDTARAVAPAEAADEGETVDAGARDSTGEALLHTVAAGDDLWSLAERHYGDGSRWRTIVEANPELRDQPLTRLAVGLTLRIPTPAEQVVVERGDTLSGIAAEHLGDAGRWPEIHALNAAVVADPDLIHPGWVLDLPAPPEPASTEPLAREEALAASDEEEPSAAVPDAAAVTPPSSPAPLPSVAAPSADVPAADALAPEALAPELLAPEADLAPVVGVLGGLGAVCAGAVLTGLGARRRRQEQARPLGRRYATADDDSARHLAALTRLAPAGGPPDRAALLARAMRHLGRHWWEHEQPAPRLDQVLLGPDDVEFRFAVAPASVPDGFTRVQASLAVGWAALAGMAEVDHPVAYPGLVTLGEAEPGRVVMVDLVACGVLGVRDEEGTAGEVLTGLLVEVSCSPWAEEVDLLVVTDDPDFADAAGEGRILTEVDVEAAVATVERIVAQRSRFIPAGSWDAGRLDPDLAEAWSALVVLFERAPDAGQVARLEAAVEGRPCGVAVVAVVEEAEGTAVDWVLVPAAAGGCRLRDAHAEVVPQTVPAGTRRALTDLHRLASSQTPDPAPWWHQPSEDDMRTISLHPVPEPRPADGPRLLLLGPVELRGCTGPEPARALRQCVEYCAWLHLHPGGTPRQMVQSLLVAEGTRRSNMSRLRTWLGRHPDGTLYLPDAYSGRISLHPDITSDWDEVTLLTAGGVNRQPLERLLAALALVRGAPLADAAPGQWGWAEEFRTDAAALVRDVGVVAARLARERGDLDTARWAANRALTASPDDELLLGERIRIEQAAGHTDEVHRLVQRVTRTARVLGVDLLPSTIDLCQGVVEGRLRARA